MHDRPILPDGRVPQRDRSRRAPMGYRSRRGGAATSERLRWEHNAQYHRWRLRQLPSCLSGCSTSAVAQPGWRGANGLGQPCPRAGPLVGDTALFATVALLPQLLFTYFSAAAACSVSASVPPST